MPTFEETWMSIGPLWAALNDAEGRIEGGTLVLDGSTPTRLAPSSADAAGDAVVLSVRTADVEQPPRLPDGGDVFGAPLGPYDAVELTMFGRPAAKGRVAFGEGIAVVGRFEFNAGANPEELGPALVSALAEEAFLEGAEVIYTILDGTDTPSHLGSGWTEAGRLERS